MKININLKVNRLVKYFVLSDLILLAGWGLSEPIFSIFIIKNIAGATLATVGIAAAIYWMVKAALQIPIANFLDRHPGEKDDFYALIIGISAASITALGFAFVTKIWQLYALQVFHAIAFALYTPSWSGIFSRHLDKDRTSFDWSLDSTAIAIGMSVSGFFGSIIAGRFGFTTVFVLVSILSMAGALTLFLAPSLILPKETTAEDSKIIDHKPTNIGQ